MKIKSTLFIFSLSVFFVACSKDKEIIQPEPLVSKTVAFTLVPAADYTAESYNNATAEVKLSIYKQFDNPYSTSVIWDTVIQKQSLKAFMTLPLNIIEKDIPAFKEEEYKIGAGYNIEYVTGPLQYKTWSAFGGVADYGNRTFKVKVSL